MQGLSTIVLLAGYLLFCTVLLTGQRAWLEAQTARLDSVLNSSKRAWACALAEDLSQSGLVVVFSGVSLSVCAPQAWRPEVVGRVS